MMGGDERAKTIKTVRHWILVLVFLLLVLVVLKIRLTDVTVIGAEKYDDEEAVSMVFSDYWDSNTFVCLVNKLLDRKKDLPFISDYEIDLTGPFSCDLIIYEKSPVGCINYMDSFMYFDGDGVIIESSTRRLEGIPVIQGIDFGHIVLGETLPVADTGVFTDIMTVTQQLDMYGIGCETIFYSNSMEITLTLEGGNIKVELGTNENISSKISVLNDMLSELENKELEGTLYLDNYDESSTEDAVTFRLSGD